MFFGNKIDFKGNIKSCRSYGTDQRKILVARIATLDDKQELMEKKNRLKGTNIFINHDRTTREKETQRKIYQIAKEKEAEGAKVKMGFKSLTVNDTHMIWKEGTGLIESFRERGRGRFTNRDLSEPRSEANSPRGTPRG